MKILEHKSPGGGGGAAAAVPGITPPPTQTGMWTPLWPYQVFQTCYTAVGEVIVARAVLAQAINTAAVEVTSFAAGASYKFVAYADDNGQQPGAKIAEAPSAISGGSSNGVKQGSIAVPAGPCWLGLQNVGSAQAGLRGIDGYNPNAGSTQIPGGTTKMNAINRTGQGAVIMDPFSWQGGYGIFPAIFVKAGT